MTPAIDLLNKHGIVYVIHEYDHDPDSHSYGMEAATKLGLDPLRVFKTLVVVDEKNSLYVGMVPVSKQLNLKKLASVLKVKKLVMAEARRVERVSGYVVGGVSPLGQKKRLKTVLDSGGVAYESIYISGGKRGLDLEISPQDLVTLLDATEGDISTD